MEYGEMLSHFQNPYLLLLRVFTFSEGGTGGGFNDQGV
jgi:hypothetical protein